MVARLENSFQQIREFTLHASHELKTPLTVMRGELETAMLQTKVGDEQRERLLSELDEVLRLTKIVDGLTLLTKADAGQVRLTDREPVRLDDLVRDCFEDAKILAEARDVQVCLGEVEQVRVMGDRHRLRQLLLNLSDNAVKYFNVEKWRRREQYATAQERLMEWRSSISPNSGRRDSLRNYNSACLTDSSEAIRATTMLSKGVGLD